MNLTNPPGYILDYIQVTGNMLKGLSPPSSRKTPGIEECERIAMRYEGPIYREYRPFFVGTH